jgi:hypothetical protein
MSACEKSTLNIKSAWFNREKEAVEDGRKHCSRWFASLRGIMQLGWVMGEDWIAGAIIIKCHFPLGGIIALRGLSAICTVSRSSQFKYGEY